MKLLKARKTARGYKYAVHWDETKPATLDEGEFNPEAVEEYTWGLAPPEGVTVDDYEASHLREMKLLLEPKAAPADEGVALATEGKAL